MRSETGTEDWAAEVPSWRAEQRRAMLLALSRPHHGRVFHFLQFFTNSDGIICGSVIRVALGRFLFDVEATIVRKRLV